MWRPGQSVIAEFCDITLDNWAVGGICLSSNLHSSAVFKNLNHHPDLSGLITFKETMRKIISFILFFIHLVLCWRDTDLNTTENPLIFSSSPSQLEHNGDGDHS